MRRDALAGRLDELSVDALLVTRLLHTRYLTGFTGSNGQVLVRRDGGLFLTDGRYTEQSRREVPDLAGVFTITASENLTNCYAHGPGNGKRCPRCGKRKPEDVIAEVNDAVAAGIATVPGARRTAPPPARSRRRTAPDPPRRGAGPAR